MQRHKSRLLILNRIVLTVYAVLSSNNYSNSDNERNASNATEYKKGRNKPTIYCVCSHRGPPWLPLTREDSWARRNVLEAAVVDGLGEERVAVNY
jgi:hypothetical protein